jgi:hypothetical protein
MAWSLGTRCFRRKKSESGVGYFIPFKAKPHGVAEVPVLENSSLLIRWWKQNDNRMRQGKILTVRLTSIDHPQIEGAYISGLRAVNFIFLVCVWSSGE